MTGDLLLGLMIAAAILAGCSLVWRELRRGELAYLRQRVQLEALVARGYADVVGLVMPYLDRLPLEDQAAVQRRLEELEAQAWVWKEGV